MKAREFNFDGLVGPTHNYAGLSFGNVASKINAQSDSNPKEGALQGLKKMKALADQGFAQGFLPPNARPDLSVLKQLGFTGTEEELLKKATEQAPQVLSSVFSASSMWTANAATVSPSADTKDQRVHFTPANLANKFHRFIEPEQTGAILRAVFPNESHFQHHKALPSHEWFGDEGAANHTRFCSDYASPGVEFFVFGRHGDRPGSAAPKKFPARQTLEASQAVARLHDLAENRVVFAQQNPDVIDAGVFHNDVIAVGNRNVLFYHEEAFHEKEVVRQSLSKAFGDTEPFHFIEVPTSAVSVQDAVTTYLFNSQLLSRNEKQMTLVVPSECEENQAVAQYLETLKEADNPIDQVLIYDVKQSMRNGGGPACLRLRVVLNEEEELAVHQPCLVTDESYELLVNWVEKHYRDSLSFDDLKDPKLIEESYTALDELTQLLKLGSIYPFQK